MTLSNCSSGCSGGGGSLSHTSSPGTRDLIAFKRIGERAFVVNEAARGRDEIGVRLHHGELARADHPARLSIEGTVDGYEIGAPQQLVQRHLGRASRADSLLIEVGVAGNHLHREQAATELGHARADIAQADNADGTTFHVSAHEG
jgi:hypothetical protein